jgi:hypothetical protein
MWTVFPQRGLHSAGICFRHADIRETFADGKSGPAVLFKRRAPPSFYAPVSSLTPFPLFSIFELNISKLKTLSFISEENIWSSEQ